MCGIVGKGTNSIFLFLLGLVQHPFATHTQEKRIEKDNRADCFPSFAFAMYASTKHEEEITPLLINSDKRHQPTPKSVKTLALTGGLIIAGTTATAIASHSYKNSPLAPLSEEFQPQLAEHTQLQQLGTSTEANTTGNGGDTFARPSQYEYAVEYAAEAVQKNDTKLNRKNLVWAVMDAYKDPERWLTGFEDDQKAPITLKAETLDRAMKTNKSESDVEAAENDLVEAILSVRNDWLTEAAKQNHLTQEGEKQFLDDVVFPEIQIMRKDDDAAVELGKKIKFVDKASRKKDLLSQAADIGQAGNNNAASFYQAYQAMKMYFATPGLGKKMD